MTSKVQPDSPQKFVYIDVIRGLAIFGVIAAHVAPLTSHLSKFLTALTNTGVYGVQLFFAASAFTLLLSYERSSDDPDRIKNFFVRRFLRIAPMYYVGLAVYFIADRLRGLPLPDGLFGKIVLNLCLLHGLLPKTLSALVPGGWSIGVEFLFYLMLPALAVVVSNRRSLLFAYVSSLLLAGLWHLTLGYWIKSFGSVEAGRGLLFTWIPNQLPVFLAGAGAYCVARDRPEIIAWIKSHYRSAWAIECALLACGKATGTLSYFWSPAVFGLAFAFLIILLSARTPTWMKVLFARLGVFSFSIYVLHFLFNHMLTPVISRVTGSWLGDNAGSSFFRFGAALSIVTLLSMAIAAVTWRYIEKPFIDLARRRPSRVSRPHLMRVVGENG